MHFAGSERKTLIGEFPPSHPGVSMKFVLKSILTLVFSSALTLSAFAEGSSKKTIVEIAVGAGNFQTLVTALKAADLVETLAGKGPFTVFAPTDAAFAKLPAGTVEFLLQNTDKLTDVLTYHVVDGKRSPSCLIKDRFTKTLLGKDVEVKGNDRKVLLVNNSMVIAVPIYASNGIIYVIDAVLIP